ncbi:hypothetical protein, partial [Parvibaculum sp.]|uniref:hypothetical protein n=1 Tax=Parvibaculum sp. TaxID=2024848 RepID=UPI00329A3166
MTSDTFWAEFFSRSSPIKRGKDFRAIGQDDVLVLRATSVGFRVQPKAFQGVEQKASTNEYFCRP